MFLLIKKFYLMHLAKTKVMIIGVRRKNVSIKIDRCKVENMEQASVTEVLYKN